MLECYWSCSHARLACFLFETNQHFVGSARIAGLCFLKVAHLSFSMGPTPLLKMVLSYGLRPRLWLLLLAKSLQVCSSRDWQVYPVFVQKELYLIIFVGHLNLRQPKNSKSKRNVSAINCRFCQAFWRRSRSVRTISFEVSKSLAANICTFHCTVKVL